RPRAIVLDPGWAAHGQRLRGQTGDDRHYRRGHHGLQEYSPVESSHHYLRVYCCTGFLSWVLPHWIPAAITRKAPVCPIIWQDQCKNFDNTVIPILAG